MRPSLPTKGVTSSNVDEMLASGDTETIRLLVAVNFRAVWAFQQMLYQVIKQVGNYDEIYT